MMTVADLLTLLGAPAADASAALLGVLIAGLGVWLGTRPTHGPSTTGTPSRPAPRPYIYGAKEFVVPSTISASFLFFLALPELIMGLGQQTPGFPPLETYLIVLIFFFQSAALVGWVIGFFLNVAALLVGRLVFHDFSVMTLRIGTIVGAALTLVTAAALTGNEGFPPALGFTTPGLIIFGLESTVCAAMLIFR